MNAKASGAGPREVAGRQDEAGSAVLSPSVAASTHVVIAAYQEESIIADVVREVASLGVRGVVVDDGSTDATSARAAAAGAAVLRHAVNRGQGAALQTGMTHALRSGARFVVTFDADGQHSASDVPALLEPVASGGTDVALGTRFLGSEASVPRQRRAVLKAAILFTRLVSGLPVTDTHCGLRAFSARAASSISLRLDRMAHASELLDQVRRSGLSWVEVPVHVRYTTYSRAKGQRPSAAFRIVLDYLLGKWLG